MGNFPKYHIKKIKRLWVNYQYLLQKIHSESPLFNVMISVLTPNLLKGNLTLIKWISFRRLSKFSLKLIQAGLSHCWSGLGRVFYKICSDIWNPDFQGKWWILIRPLPSTAWVHPWELWTWNFIENEQDIVCMPCTVFMLNIFFSWHHSDLPPTLQEAGFNDHAVKDNLETYKIMHLY